MLFAQYYIDGKPHEVIQKGFPKRNAFNYRYFYNEKECRDYIQMVLNKSWYAKESLLKLPLLRHCDSLEVLEDTFVKLVMEKKLEVTLDCPTEMPAMVRPRYKQPEIILPKPPPVPEPEGERLDYKIVVEVAGVGPGDSQRINLSKDSEGRDALQGPQPHNAEASKHRSLVTLKGIPSEPRGLFIYIPMKGEPALRLRLVESASPVEETTDKASWENIIVPLKPLGYITEAMRRDQSALLPDGGWVYVFWRGKLWRELKVVNGMFFRDVRVEYFRNQRHGRLIKVNGDLRPALGMQLHSIWVPFKLNGEVQQGANAVHLLYSYVQWSWDKISELESNTAKLQKEGTSIDQIMSYESGKHFDHQQGNIGPIVSALTHQVKTEDEQNLNEQEIPRLSKHPKLIDRQRATKIPVVYLKVIDKRIILHFEMDSHAPKSRNDLFTLKTTDNSWQHASKPTVETCEFVDGTSTSWLELVFYDVPESGEFNLIQDPQEKGKKPFYIFRNMSYETLRTLNYQS
ncbi:hypothetical protein KCM76_12260 [Zooshikella marina]|uniref:hypothetical protein n=1 Tax=Zooshikella ganghwensis TaxID=202772 RepID=UPI001BAF52F6|nr:hypothetical protein [Zooshikella ganghwensis]MBU2706758.1 hypothetical protein [Zooshikella ganghwensis]